MKELNLCNFLLSFLLASFWSPYFHVLSVFPCFKGNWEETTYSAGFLKIWGHGITLIRIFFIVVLTVYIRRLVQMPLHLKPLRKRLDLNLNMYDLKPSNGHSHLEASLNLQNIKTPCNLEYRSRTCYFFASLGDFFLRHRNK